MPQPKRSRSQESENLTEFFIIIVIIVFSLIACPNQNEVDPRRAEI